MKTTVEVGGVEPATRGSIVSKVSIGVLRNSREYFADDQPHRAVTMNIATVDGPTRKGRTRALARPSRRSPTASYRVPPNGTLRMLSRLVGVVIMGHSAHRAIAGYARPPQAPRPSLCNGPERRAIADSERNPSEAGSLARGARRRAGVGPGR